MEQKGCTNLKVAIRIRPLIATEKEKKLRLQWGTQNNVIFQIDDSGQKFGEAYSFDHIFEPNKTNLQIYDDIVKDFVASSLDGVNSTIFAYGQTSSGKTYTMLGDKNDTGIMSLAIEYIFDNIKNNSDRKFLLTVSYIEIYNEKIQDLLDPSKKDLKITHTQTIGLQDAKEELVSTKEQMYNCLKTGNLNRHIGSTKANEKSSRSHTIFKIMIESTEKCDFNSSRGCVQISNLNLVDLAGSERVAQTKATGIRLKEGSAINKSLSTLGLVIKQLSDGQEFVNFRDSKLTRLLQDSLGGNSKTLIIATITLASIEDTGSTLAFAQRAKTVKNKPQVNEILTDADVSKRYAALNAQLQKKLEEQSLVNKKLQEENTREMTRLQQQIELLEDFQFGKRNNTVSKIPKRRHTIGFSPHHKVLLPKNIPDLEKSSELSEDTIMFEDFTYKELPSGIGTLETIMEEESTPKPTKKSSTPERYLRMRLSALEEDYSELVTFTRDEKNIFKENAEKTEELENQLEAARRQLEEHQNEFKSREDEMCSRIAELEQLQNKPEKNDLVNNSEVTDMKDLLIRLHGLLNNPDLNDLQNCVDMTQNSVLQIIEKFNVKVKTSKNIIESEILRQINSLDQDVINIPNELASFNDLLSELSSFESIPVDLINNMKKESVEDFKILIKVYESLLRKNELIRICSEKIKFLEENAKFHLETLEKEIKNLKIQELDLRDQLSNEITSALEIRHNRDVLKQNYDDKVKENENLLVELEKLKGVMKTSIDELNLTVTDKDKFILQLENNSVSLIKNNEKSIQESAALCSENKKLYTELEELKASLNKLTSEMLQKEQMIAEFKANYTRNALENDDIINKFNKEKQCLLEEIEQLKDVSERYNEERGNLEKTCAKLKEEKDSLNQDYSNIFSKNQALKEENEIAKSESKLHYKNFINLQNELQKLSSDLSSKNASLLDSERHLASLQQEVEKWKNKSSEMLLENQYLKNDIENLKVNETQTNNLRDNVEKLTFQLNEKSNMIIDLQKQTENLNIDVKDLEDKLTVTIAENEFLKEEICGMKNSFTDNLKISKTRITDLEINIDTLTLQIKEKENMMIEMQKEKETLNMNIQRDFSNMKNEYETCKRKINNLSKEISTLTSELNVKKLALSELETDYRVLNQENTSLKREIETLKTNSENTHLKNTIERLSLDIKQKDSQKENLLREFDQINAERTLHLEKIVNLELELNKLTAELKRKNAEAERCKNDYFSSIHENQSLKNEVDYLKNSINNLSAEIFEKNKIISETEEKSKSLNNEIDKLKNTIGEHTRMNSSNDQKLNQNELKVQRYKQMLNNAQAQISDLKQSLADKEKLKCEISRYKCEILISSKKLEEYSRLNEQLNLQIKGLQVQMTKANGCDENCSLKISCREKDITINELSDIKDKLQVILCSIIEQCIGDQKQLLSNRYSQEVRDHFKIILKELKSNTINLKNLFIAIRNQKKFDFAEISDNLLKSRSVSKSYYNSEKSFMQKQIEHLKSTNGEYLQEMMALKDMLKVDGKNECPHCASLQKEVSKLHDLTVLQDKTFSDLRNKITKLEKENFERMKDIVKLQTQIYDEQDKKAEVQYTDFLNFYRENDGRQKKEIKQLQEQIEEYRKTSNKPEETHCQGSKVKNWTNINGENNMNHNNVPVPSSTVAVQCDLLDPQKYGLLKKVCRTRMQEITTLKDEIKNLERNS